MITLILNWLRQRPPLYGRLLPVGQLPESGQNVTLATIQHFWGMTAMGNGGEPELSAKSRLLQGRSIAVVEPSGSVCRSSLTPLFRHKYTI